MHPSALHVLGGTLRTRTTATVTAGLLLAVLTACGTGRADRAVGTPTVSTPTVDAPTEDAPTVDAPEVPAYTVANKIERFRTGSVDLIVPNATEASAEAAIHDYVKTIDQELLDYGINVIRDKDDKGIDDYVCHGEWLKHEGAARVYTGGRFTSDTWPATGIWCGDAQDVYELRSARRQP
ncbi:hypothetical protein ACIO1C_08515 [Streptomyces sp. NPDC087420]|uniref:hypothetical protein n=1 Tax=Streptomyces sp. NPDC087420 TaxID=3365785 RepID=UPI0038374ED8